MIVIKCSALAHAFYSSCYAIDKSVIVFLSRFMKQISARYNDNACNVIKNMEYKERYY